ELRPMRMREDVEHARYGKRIRRLDAFDAAFGNSGRYDKTVREPRHVVFRGIFCGSGDLLASLYARGRLAEMHAGRHGALPAHLIRLSACDCGVPREAWVSARTMLRRASSI